MYLPLSPVALLSVGKPVDFRLKIIKLLQTRVTLTALTQSHGAVTLTFTQILHVWTRFSIVTLHVSTRLLTVTLRVSARLSIVTNPFPRDSQVSHVVHNYFCHTVRLSTVTITAYFSQTVRCYEHCRFLPECQLSQTLHVSARLLVVANNAWRVSDIVKCRRRYCIFLRHWSR